MKFILCISLVLYFCNSISAQPWFNRQDWANSATSNPNTASVGMQGINRPDGSNRQNRPNRPDRPNNRPPWAGGANRPNRPNRPQEGDFDYQLPSEVERSEKLQERLLSKHKKKGGGGDEHGGSSGGHKNKGGCRSDHINMDGSHIHHEMERAGSTPGPEVPISRADTINTTPTVV